MKETIRWSLQASQGWLALRSTMSEDEIAARAYASFVRDFGDTDAGRYMASCLVDFLPAWAESGFPAIQLSHKHAALLMCCNMNVSPEELLFPWPALVIHIPVGIITALRADRRPGTVDITTAFVVMKPGSGRFTVIHGTDIAPRTCFAGLSSEAMSKQVSSSLEDDGVPDPAMRLIVRLVAGAIMEISEHRPAIEHGERRSVSRSKRGTPETTTFTLTRDVRVDCRPAVRAHLRDGASSPIVQSLVRGHLKRQPCGPGGQERKLIVIDPYWRGPEEAPIAVRSHVLPGGNAELAARRLHGDDPRE